MLLFLYKAVVAMSRLVALHIRVDTGWPASASEGLGYCRSQSSYTALLHTASTGCVFCGIAYGMQISVLCHGRSRELFKREGGGNFPTLQPSPDARVLYQPGSQPMTSIRRRYS